jgi:hypothetical protein
MADKRISQLVERINIANNDVLPIVASGATTTNKVTISTIQDWMQDNLDVGVTSVGLSMPSAFTVTNSPVTTSGNISVVGAGTVSQYIRGDGSLADFPQGGGGGGASVNYYLNGSVSQGTIGGIAYREMNKTPILGTGTDFVAIADGYLASFITDAGDPGLLEIPGGNWNFETYFSASSGGGSPTFYVELYKVNSGGTATLIASNSGTPELIAFGTTITPYFSTLAVPTTSLTITDRLALRYYVARSGRTITMHTENSHLCQIITTFTTGLTALNGLTAQVQNFATGTSGTDFAISSASNIHTFNIPTASATNRGLLSSADWTTFNNKAPSVAGGYVPYTGAAANVDLGVYNLTASAVNVNGSGSNAGVINLESNAIFPLVNGYGTIGSGTTNQFNFYQTTGAGVFRGAILSLNSITESATRTYTLPDASGTLALSSDLGNYVTLSTTQTIVGQKTFTSPLTIGTTGNSIIYEQSGNLIFQTGASADLTIPSSGAATFGFGLNVTGALDVTGALSGTSATFSSNLSINTSNILLGLGNGASNESLIFSYNDNAASRSWRIIKDWTAFGDFQIQQSTTKTGTTYSDILRFTSTGAATFSSSVTATNINLSAVNSITATAGGATINSTYAGTEGNWITLQNAGGIFYTGLENSVGNSFGATPYAGVFFLSGSRNFEFFTANTRKMTLTSAGNLGIGTASPIFGSVSRLTVGNSSSDGGITIQSSSTGISRLIFAKDDTSGVEGLIRYLHSNNSMQFWTAADLRMSITSGGNVGIGTASPSEKLHVIGSAIFDNSSFGTAQIRLKGVGTSTGFDLQNSSNDGYLWNRDGGNIYFGTSNTERMRIQGTSVIIVGSLSKGSGSFKIDHPIPEKKNTHHLVHSFVEAPQADNIYRGKIELVDGLAEVNIDQVSGMTEGTFVLLNGNIQCFTSNESGWTAIRGKVEGNILKIEAEDSKCLDNISWLVIGERIDQHMIETDWTDENGKVIVEPLKEKEKESEILNEDLQNQNQIQDESNA